jgi:4-amino-4-deoxy-L-arabinose transferase-like glycosyltransferase
MKDLSRILKKYSKLLLFPIFIIALVIRWWYLPAKAISFAYDQGRDAFVVQELLSGHLKILGPPVSGVPGLFHGVLYYYVIAPAYLLGHGDPVAVAYWFSFISSLGVFVVYLLAYVLTKKTLPALLSALIFAFSFEASQYANLLTNASMGVWFVPIFYIGLFLWLKKKTSWAPLIAGLGLGFSIQSEVALAYHFAPLLFWLFVFRKQITKKEVTLFAISFLAAVSSMILVEFRFGFKGVSGILYLLSKKDEIAQAKGFCDFIITFWKQTGKTFAYTIFPVDITLGGIAGFFFIFYFLFDSRVEIKKKILSWQLFLATYLLAHSVGLLFGGSNMHHLMVGAGPGIAVLTGIFVWKYFYRNKLVFILVMSVILGTNLAMILKENKNGQTIFPLQVDLVLSKEIQAIDYTYQKASGKPFSISTLTSPLFINTLWSYLYNWYGKGRYNYLPYWVGRDQVGSLGNNLASPPKDVLEHFFIMEPTFSIPEMWVGYAKGDQDSISKLVDQRSFGDIVVQERIITPK